MTEKRKPQCGKKGDLASCMGEGQVGTGGVGGRVYTQGRCLWVDQ